MVDEWYWLQQSCAPSFDIKMSSCQYRVSHYKVKMVTRPSFYNGDSNTRNTTHFYLIRGQINVSAKEMANRASCTTTSVYLISLSFSDAHEHPCSILIFSDETRRKHLFMVSVSDLNPTRGFCRRKRSELISIQPIWFLYFRQDADLPYLDLWNTSTSC